MEVVVHRAADDLSRPLEISADRRLDRAGRHRRAAEAVGGAPPAPRGRGPLRRRAQEEAAVSARGDRRRHLADRRGHPRHPASARRPLSAPGRCCGRSRCRARARRRRSPRRSTGFNRLHAGRPGAAPRPDHRRARRRQPRRSDGVQRGDRRARRGGLGDPADLGGRPRDRHDADRPCQRPPRADPDRGGRDGGAGAARPRRRARRQDGAARAAACRGSSTSAGCISPGWRAACPTRRT